jgi:hypothetical protein
MKTTLILCALVAALVLVPGTAPGQERLKLIYSQFTMTNSATWFAREAGLFERHGGRIIAGSRFFSILSATIKVSSGHVRYVSRYAL